VLCHNYVTVGWLIVDKMFHYSLRKKKKVISVLLVQSLVMNVGT